MNLALRSRRFVLAAAFVAVSSSFLPRAAAAQDAPTDGDPPPAVVESWALAPSGSDPSEPSSRPSLTYTAAPGATIEDSVTLWNYSNVQLTFRIYPTDAFNNLDGAFDLLPADEDPEDVGAWVTVPQAYVTVPPLTRIDLPITLTVPDGAEPGDHAGAILASNQAEGTGPDGKTVALDRRTGTRIYLRVGGPLTPSLAITEAHSTYHGKVDPRDGDLDVTYTVRNVGNVRVSAQPHIDIKNPFGRTMRSADPDPVPELLPGNEVTLTQRFEGVTAAVRLSAEISLDPISSAGDDVDAARTSRTASTWAFPWVLVVIGALIAVVVQLVRRLRRRRLDGEDGAPPPPEDTSSREPVLVS